MSLFVSTSSIQSYQSDCQKLNISDTIERECLSVLHKLHDQVNGLQLVQVVVQPLAKLFNPASLAALATNVSTSPAGKQSSNVQGHGHNNSNISGGSYSNASTPSSQIASSLIGSHHQSDHDSTTTSCDTSHSNQHPRSHSFASSFSVGGGGGSNSGGGVPHMASANTSFLSSTSTYMMSPDTAQALIARLDTDRDVNWLMEIIGYGLSMPFSLSGEQDSVKDCCTIYCEWLAAAVLPFNEHNEDSKYQQLNKLVPVPIKKEPNRYARKMLSHLYNVFLPRQPIANTTHIASSKHGSQKEPDSDATLTAVSRQAVLCHRVLRTIESIAHNPTNLMDDETWNHLLALLLTVNDKLLSPPTEQDDIGTQLHDRILGVLFDLMLIASSRSIPDANMWAIFHEMCLNWRHRPALIEHWKRITSMLTKRIVALPRSSNLNDQPRLGTVNSATSNTNPVEHSISEMNYESLSQTWYRTLHLIGNPVELSDPGLISRTDEFYHAACITNSVLDPRHHPCLNVLPHIFLNSMLGLREFIDLFLSLNQSTNIFVRKPSQPDPSQAHQHRQQQADRLRLNLDRPKCNSLLHVFGDWLFSAALIGSELFQEIDSNDNQVDIDQSNMSGSITSMTSSATATEVDPPTPGYSPAFRRKQSHQSTTSSHASTSTTGQPRRNSKQLDFSGLSSKKITLEQPLTPESFELGQAEAMSILCKIFTSKSALEEVAPSYLARFYLCIQHCLNFGGDNDSSKPFNPNGIIKRNLLTSVLMNSTELIQSDLDGINLLIPAFIKAIELVFDCNEKDIPLQAPPRQHKSGAHSTSQHETSSLRRACIATLINLLAYPPHFKDLAIRNCLDGSSPTFESLRPRLMKLLFVALQTETDPVNMQILFSGLSLAIHDLKMDNCGKQHDKLKEFDRKGSLGDHQQTGSVWSEEKNAGGDNLSQSSFVYNSRDGFLIKSLHVTCYLLLNTWKHDNTVSLAALEVLTTIARISAAIDSASVSKKQSAVVNTNNNNVIEMTAEYMQTTKWICDYICNQCSRPPPAHSRDMHSTIVAAYQCLSVWFYNHPYLLNDENCISILMEVIELGVSGQKSKSMSVNPTVSVATQTIISKGEKHLKPSSMRVREAAESLLNICLVRTRHDGNKNISLCDTALDEMDIVNIFKQSTNMRSIQQEHHHYMDIYSSFRYFSDENSVVFGLLDLSKYETPSRDYSICLLRTPFGKHCWKFSFSYCSETSREKIVANKTLGLMKRPFQPNSGTFATDTNLAFPFQKSHNRSIYINKTAKFFPDSVQEIPMNDLDRLVTSLDDYVRGGTSVLPDNDPIFGLLDKMNKIYSHQVLAEQKVVSELHARRPITKHDCEEPQPLGDFDAVRIITTHFGLKNRLQPLTSDGRVSQTFIDGIKTLDSLAVRTQDSVNVFYVRRNKTSMSEILESTRDRGGLSMDFFDWLLDLGRPTGVVGGGCGDGAITNQVLNDERASMNLIWTDMCQELKFFVPTRMDSISSSQVIICWLECFDDMANMPAELVSTHTETIQFYIHPMKSGLFRVDLSVPHALPLVDRMTLGKSTLASLIRESILNCCRRKRLDADGYHPTHVKRRHLLTELCNNFRCTNRSRQ